MKKVGVLTFHRAYNFGAVLQTYALQKTIEKNGFESQIIDYRNPKIEKWFHNATLKVKIKNFVKYFLYHSYTVQTLKKAKKFKKFTDENINLSKVYHGAEQFKNDYNAVVVGSDQVWNLQMTDGDFNFFLPYDNGAKKLSYSASFGKSTVPDIYKNQIKERLDSFESLYVRESDGVRLINEICGKEASRTSDPTLLLDKNEWKKVSKPVATDRKYILLYIVAPQTYTVELAKKLAEKNGYEVIHVDPTRTYIEGVRSLTDVGPGEFLYLIEHAECLMTTSFHGLILALNYNTPFLYELNSQKENTNSRLTELSDTYSLDKYRITSSNADDYSDMSYDWDFINEKIISERKNSLDRLISSLS